MIVGVTGGIGSGKSTVCAMFADLGVPTTSADDIARQIIDTNPIIFNKIISKFNKEYIAPDGKLDRQKLRTKIFNSDADRIWLEQLLHPLIMQQIAEYGKNINYPYCIVEIPLLLEAKFQTAVDQVLIVDSSEEQQVARTSARDNSTKTEIKKIMSIQLTREERLKSNYKVLDNSSGLDSLQKSVMALHEHYLALAMTKN